MGDDPRMEQLLQQQVAAAAPPPRLLTAPHPLQRHSALAAETSPHRHHPFLRAPRSQLQFTSDLKGLVSSEASADTLAEKLALQETQLKTAMAEPSRPFRAAQNTSISFAPGSEEESNLRRSSEVGDVSKPKMNSRPSKAGMMMSGGPGGGPGGAERERTPKTAKMFLRVPWRSFVPSFLRSFVPSFLRVPSRSLVFLRSLVPSFLRSSPFLETFFFHL